MRTWPSRDDDIYDKLGDPPMYFNRQGKPITLRWWAYLSRNEGKRVAETTIGDLWVSTVWLGMDQGMHGLFGDEGEPYRPIIFETMVFQVDRPNYSDVDRSLSVLERMRIYTERNDAKLGELHPEVRAWIEQAFRYCTEEEAIEGHDKVCVQLRVLMANIAMAEDITTEAITKAHNDRPRLEEQ